MARTPAFGKMKRKKVSKRTTAGKRGAKVHGKESSRY